MFLELEALNNELPHPVLQPNPAPNPLRLLSNSPELAQVPVYGQPLQPRQQQAFDEGDVPIIYDFEDHEEGDEILPDDFEPPSDDEMPDILPVANEPHAVPIENPPQPPIDQPQPPVGHQLPVPRRGLGSSRNFLMRAKARFLAKMERYGIDYNEPYAIVMVPEIIDVPALMIQASQEIRRLQVTQSIVSHGILGTNQSRLHRLLRIRVDWHQLGLIDKQRMSELYRWLNLTDNSKYRMLVQYWTDKTEEDFPLYRETARRSSFSDDQIQHLSQMFEGTLNRGHPTVDEMSRMAQSLQISFSRVRTWVKNCRARERRTAREVPLEFRP